MAEVEFPSELAESEQSVEEASQQEASVDVQQSQDTAARETTQQEGVESDHEAITQQAERVEPDQEATQQEGVEPDQEEAPQQEASVDVEQPQDTAARETTQQEEVESDHEAITQQAKQVESDQEATQQEGVESDQEVTLQQEGIEPDQEVTLLQELLQLGQERVEPEQEVTLQQERVEPDASQEERAVPTSQALLPQSTSRPGMLSALLPGISKERALIRIKDLFIGIRSSLTHQIQPTGGDANKDASFLQRVQRFILGEQKHTTMAVALIETPMRIQPTQNYAIRIQIIGRDQLEDEAQTGGLSALSHGDVVHIEVRLALYQSYAYMVQQADVAIPASGYAAEVTVPMHPLSSGPSSRRERLHIFFMDRERNPLYEKPFVIELFVSPLVQLGHEGHNVLSIPI